MPRFSPATCKRVQSRTAAYKRECDVAAFHLYLKLLESLEGGKQTGWKTVRLRRERVGRIAPKLCMEEIKSNRRYEKLSLFLQEITETLLEVAAARGTGSRRGGLMCI